MYAHVAGDAVDCAKGRFRRHIPQRTASAHSTRNNNKVFATHTAGDAGTQGNQMFPGRNYVLTKIRSTRKNEGRREGEERSILCLFRTLRGTRIEYRRSKKRGDIPIKAI